MTLLLEIAMGTDGAGTAPGVDVSRTWLHGLATAAARLRKVRRRKWDQNPVGLGQVIVSAVLMVRGAAGSIVRQSPAALAPLSTLRCI